MNNDQRPFVRMAQSSDTYMRLLVPGGQSVFMKAGAVSLAAGDSVGEHSTEAREEALIITQGHAQVSLGTGEHLDASAGSFVYIPAHTRHNVTNPGPDLLRYIFVVSPI